MPKKFTRAAARSLILATVVLLGCAHATQPPGGAPAAAKTTPPGRLQACSITRVPDGDSLEALCQRAGRSQRLKIRIRGIDAPELGQPHGQTARQRLTRLCLRQAIELPPQPAKDRYGRVLADIRCQQQDAGEHMVRGGHAWYYRGTAAEYPQLVRLQAQAQRQKLGLWGGASPTPPWTWRRQNPRQPGKAQ